MLQHKLHHFSFRSLMLCVVFAVALVLACSAVLTFSNPPVANARPAFNAGNIISDPTMRAQTMSRAQIQSFLNAKGANCTSGSNCLKNYKQGGKTAAQIIYETGQRYRINPQTLLVLIQKEVGIVTMNNPESWRYRTVAGYGCPDSTPGVCDKSYYGFSNQLKWAATMFDAILRNSPTWYAPYRVGQNNILYHPSNSCGTQRVNIQNRATAALYSYTPYVPNKAALNAGYGTGDRCSSYGNRNFFYYFSDWFGSPVITLRGAIGSKYNSLGGASGPLGGPEQNERCGLAQNGCYQRFTNGSIYWTERTGAQAIWGGIRSKWGSFKYEAGQLGYPIADEACGLAGGGCYQSFQGGRIYWTEPTGARAVWGGIKNEYAQNRYENSTLRYPVADEACGLAGGGCYQSFQGGRIYWSERSGAWRINGAISTMYYSLGSENGVHKYPTSREQCGLTGGGCYQQFQNGRIYWTAALGAQSTRGAIGEKYKKYGAHNTHLGYPTATERCGLAGGGCYQQFQGGRVYWSPTSGSFVVNGAILNRYAALGAQNSHLSYPTADAVCTASGCSQQFKNGRIYWSQATGAWPSWGGIGAEYLKRGGPAGALGYPTSGESYNASTKTWSQTFTSGTIRYSEAAGATVQLRQQSSSASAS